MACVKETEMSLGFSPARPSRTPILTGGDSRCVSTST